MIAVINGVFMRHNCGSVKHTVPCTLLGLIQIRCRSTHCDRDFILFYFYSFFIEKKCFRENPGLPAATKVYVIVGIINIGGKVMLSIFVFTRLTMQ